MTNTTAATMTTSDALCISRHGADTVEACQLAARTLYAARERATEPSSAAYLAERAADAVHWRMRVGVKLAWADGSTPALVEAARLIRNTNALPARRAELVAELRRRAEAGDEAAIEALYPAPLLDLDPAPNATNQEELAMNANTAEAARQAIKIAEERRQDAEDALAAMAAELRAYLDTIDASAGQNLGAAVAASAVRMAEAEGAYKAWAAAAAIFRGALDAGTPADPVRLFALLLDGPDDTWSGRGNDVRRAHHDGIRRAVAEAVWLFR